MNTAMFRMLPVVAASFVLLSGCERPPAEVRYQADVAPILEKHCTSCHVPGQAGYVASGFDLEGYDSLMKGTRFGPVVLPGDPLTSVLVMLIEGRVDPSIKMPHGGQDPLTADEIRTIRTWVEQGAKNN
ncbi:MAG: c-type cytochrome domain-containing protein [Steroidobacteraceae bacterium]